MLCMILHDIFGEESDKKHLIRLWILNRDPGSIFHFYSIERHGVFVY